MPDVFVNLPATQAMQEVAFVPLKYFPTGHNWQTLAPLVLPK